MKRTLSIFALSSILGGIPALPQAGFAEEDSRWYVTAGWAGSQMNDIESQRNSYTINGVALDLSPELELDSGNGFAAGLGYDMKNDFRLELNYSKLDTNVKTVTFDSANPPVRVGLDTSGDADITTVMISLNRDFPADNGWTPYVGAGIGRSRIEVTDVTYNATELGDALEQALGGDTVLAGDKNDVWSYQVKGGVSKSVSDKADVYAEVSYNRTDAWTGGDGATAIKWNGASMMGYGVGFRYKL